MDIEHDDDTVSHEDLSSSDIELAGLFAEYADRVNAGESLDFAAIRIAHPDIAPELIEKLVALKEVDFASAADRPPVTLGDYSLLRQIGRGGMGVVYDAWQTSLGRHVALKVLPAGISADSRALTRFVREAKIAARLHHPNIVPVHGLGVDRDTPHYAMEFVEGETLAQIITRVRASEEEAHEPDTSRLLSSVSQLFRANGRSVTVETEEAAAPPAAPPMAAPPVATPLDSTEINLEYCLRIARAFAEVAEGLQHAHEKGIIHRDIKPSNLILDQETGQLRILDFGLAHWEGQESLTGTGDFLGTVLYMSPEQAMAKRVEVDHRTDIYSLGATLYEALTRQPPLRGRDSRDTMTQIIFRDPRPPSEINRRVPRDLETIALKCLRKNPGDRYGTAEAVAQDLRRFARGDPIEARPQSPWERLARRAWRRRGLVAGVAGALLLLMTASILGAKLYSDARREKKERYASLIEDAVLLREHGRLMRVPKYDQPPILDPFRKLYSVYEEDRIFKANRIERARSLLDAAIDLIPGEADAYYHRAVALVLLYHFDAAREDIRQCLDRDPTFAPVTALARVVEEQLAEEGLLEKVIPKTGPPGVTTAVTGNGGDTRSDAWLAAYRSRASGDWDGVTRAYTRLIQLEETGGERFLGAAIEARLGRGIAHMARGAYLDSSLDFAGAYARWPGHVAPALLLGESLIRMGEEDRAAEIFESFHSSVPAAREDIAVPVTLLYSAFTDWPAALNWAGRIEDEGLGATLRLWLFCQARRFEEAVGAAETALRHRPADRLVIDKMLFASLHVRENVTRLAELCRSGLRQNPKNGGLLAVLAWVHHGLGEVDKAHELFREALDVDPENVEALVAAAIDANSHRRLDEALGFLEKAARIDPNHDGVSFNLIQCYMSQGQFNKAEQVLRRDLDRNPSDHSTISRLAWVLAVQGEGEEALELCERALLWGGEDRLCCQTVGETYSMLGDLERAVEELRRVVAMEPESGGGHYLLGKHLNRRGLKDEATATLLRFIELRLGSWSPTMYLEVSDWLRNLGEFDAAFDACRVGMEFEPTRSSFYRRLLALERREGTEHDFSSRWDTFGDWLEGRLGEERKGLILTMLAAVHLHGDKRRDLPTARSLILEAIEKGDRRYPDALALLAELDFAAGDTESAVLLLEEALALPRADDWLEGRAQGLREALLPDIASRISVDRILDERAPDPVSDGELLEGFRALASEADEQRILRYLEGRVLLRAGRADEAVAVFSELREEETASAGLLKWLVKSLRAAGNSIEAQGLCHEALSTDHGDDRDLWNLWTVLGLADLARSPRELLEAFPVGGVSASAAGEAPAKGPQGYAADIACLLAQLDAGRPLRIQCGNATGYRDATDRPWSKDRFFVGGSVSGAPGMPVHGTEDDRVYRWLRSSSHYEIPLPRGLYEVTLHFVEWWFDADGCRRFDVQIEGETVLEDYDIRASAGFAAADARRFARQVNDGLLEIVFVDGAARPTIAAIEVRRLEER